MSRYPQALSFKGFSFVQIIILQEEGLKKKVDELSSSLDLLTLPERG
jgi:hypothetical protein